MELGGRLPCPTCIIVHFTAVLTLLPAFSKIVLTDKYSQFFPFLLSFFSFRVFPLQVLA